MTMHRIAAAVVAAGMLAAQAAAIDQPGTLPPPQPSAPQEPAAAKKPEAQKPDGDDGLCDLCGGCACVRKVCVPRPKEREIKKTCWSYKCEDFCIPGPSACCGRKCGGKDECGCWFYDLWKPTCAEIHTKRVPVKTEVKRKMPGVEWVPEERCAACRCRGGTGPGFWK